MLGLPFGKYLGTYRFIPLLKNGFDPCPSAPMRPALKSLEEPGYQERYYVAFVVDNPLPKDTLKNDMEVDLQNQSRLCKKISLVKASPFNYCCTQSIFINQNVIPIMSPKTGVVPSKIISDCGSYAVFDSVSITRLKKKPDDESYMKHFSFPTKDATKDNTRDFAEYPILRYGASAHYCKYIYVINSILKNYNDIYPKCYALLICTDIMDKCLQTLVSKLNSKMPTHIVAYFMY